MGTGLGESRSLADSLQRSPRAPTTTPVAYRIYLNGLREKSNSLSLRTGKQRHLSHSQFSALRSISVFHNGFGEPGINDNFDCRNYRLCTVPQNHCEMLRLISMRKIGRFTAMAGPNIWFLILPDGVGPLLDGWYSIQVGNLRRGWPDHRDRHPRHPQPTTPDLSPGNY